MEDTFYATIKLISGEEIFSVVCPCDHEEETIILLENPVIIEPIVTKSKGFSGYKIYNWMNVHDDELIALKMDKIITMTEIRNSTIITAYKKFVKNSSQVSLSKDLGLISTVESARRTLEKIYKSK
jgi:hypothetical protein